MSPTGRDGTARSPEEQAAMALLVSRGLLVREVLPDAVAPCERFVTAWKRIPYSTGHADYREGP